MCIRTILVPNPKYRANKKNKGIVPECKDRRLLYVPVACGRCFECRRKKASEWMARLSEEIRNHNKCHFITMTYNNASLSILRAECKEKGQIGTNNEIAALSVRRWLERIRKQTKKSIKHWIVTELTDEGRIHLHGLIWAERNYLELWKYGFTYVGTYVTEKTINYIVKYILKTNYVDKYYRPKIMASSGIGIGYLYDEKRVELNFYQGEETDQTYRTRTGRKIHLPEYYRNKIYTDEEREKLWMHAIDRGYRWIDGQKVSTDNYKELEEMLLDAQRKDTRISRIEEAKWDAEKERKKRERMKKKNKFK